VDAAEELRLSRQTDTREARVEARPRILLIPKSGLAMRREQRRSGRLLTRGSLAGALDVVPPSSPGAIARAGLGHRRIVLSELEFDAGLAREVEREWLGGGLLERARDAVECVGGG
jgi:hypothetical protein